MLNDDQLKGIAGGLFQLGDITLVAALIGPLFADPEQWPKRYGIPVAGLFGVASWIFLWSFAVSLLAETGRRAGGSS